MTPIHVKGCNGVVSPAASLSRQGFDDIPIQRRGDTVTSYWEPTEDERRRLFAGAALRITAPFNHPPVLVAVEDR